MKSGVAVLLALTAIMLVIFVARPMWDDILTLRAKSAIIADSLARFKEVESLRDELLNTYNSIPKSDMDRLLKFLPAKANTEDLLVTIEDLARTRGIILKNVSFTAEPVSAAQPVAEGESVPAAPPPRTVAYSFAVSTTYESFRSFMEAAEKSLRLMDMSDVGFTASASALGQGNIFEFALKAKSYYQR